MGAVKPSEHRDEQTLQIFITLLVFVAVLTTGALVLLLAHLTVGLDESLGRDLFLAVTAVAATLALGRLVRRNGSR